MRSTAVSTLTVLFHGIRVAQRVFKSDELRSAAFNKRRVERIVCGRNVLLSEREHIIAPKIQTSGARRPVFLFLYLQRISPLLTLQSIHLDGFHSINVAAFVGNVDSVLDGFTALLRPQVRVVPLRLRTQHRRQAVVQSHGSPG